MANTISFSFYVYALSLSLPLFLYRMHQLYSVRCWNRPQLSLSMEGGVSHCKTLLYVLGALLNCYSMFFIKKKLNYVNIYI